MSINRGMEKDVIIFGVVYPSRHLTMTPWTIAHQAPLFSWDFQGKNTGYTQWNDTQPFAEIRVELQTVRVKEVKNKTNIIY